MSGHISRFQKNVIEQWIACGLVAPSRILDAGCGPLTLERRLSLPVFGVDINRHMLELGSGLSPHHGTNTTVGQLTELPAEWSATFELTVASMVLDLTSLSDPSHGLPERVRILQEFVRVTNPHGLVWLTWSDNCHTSATFEAWTHALERAGCHIRHELTGAVHATDHEEQPCQFWSLVFSPAATMPAFSDPDMLKFAFEVERSVERNRGRASSPKLPKTKRHVTHERFEVTTAKGPLVDAQAAKGAVVSELIRWMNTGVTTRRLHRATMDVATLFACDWRMLRELQRRGIIRK
jgi:SAM-dependent methyltransferase